VKAKVKTSLADLIEAQKRMRKADRQIRKQIEENMQREKINDELRKIAAERVKSEAADKAAAEAKAAEDAKASQKKQEADRLREQQGAEQREERKKESRVEAKKRPEESRGQVRKRPEESWAGARGRPGDSWAEARRRPGESWAKARGRPGESWAEARGRPGESWAEARGRPEEKWAEARGRPGESWARARGGSEDSCMGARKRPEAGWAEAEEAGAGGEGRHVRERVVQDRLGCRQEGGRGHPPGQEGLGMRPEYRIPRKDRSWRTAGAPGGVPLSYEGYIITAPRSLAEETALQHLMKRGMLFRAPEEGPDKYRGPHFRFTSGEASPDSERADRRRGRSPGWQETAKKRHRD